jgi:hypothetical protein
MSAESLTWDQVRAWRVSQQHLDKRAPKARLIDVVRNVCGLHAQVQSSVELQLWARVKRVTPADLQAALWEDRTLVRTWSMRGTLHVLAAVDLPLYVASLRQNDRWWKGAWLRMIEMTEPELRATLEAIRASLGARPQTREQLAEKVAARVGSKGRERMLSGWGEMLKPAAFHGGLCSGPPQGQSVTFVRPDRWIGRWTEPPAEEAWREIVRRYLRTYGPASREEFARWWGMQPAPAGRVLKASGDEITEVDVEGHRAWTLTEDLPAMKRAGGPLPVRLLGGFDVYTVGARPRAPLVDERFEKLVFRQAGWISPVVLINGRAAGVWKHEHAASHIEVAITPFARLSAARRKEIGKEADLLGEFLDSPARVSFSAAA